MKTRTPIHYAMLPCGTAVIPAGTNVIPATNLPYPQRTGYWAEPWSDMTDQEDSWMRSYGFYIRRSEVVR